ncbi:MAG: NapC/NirT family cytochrome c [Verrucomicrobia bacterium]|nr:NapC/NirT family cytochrome c [Verrucomicrobiota bacterium]
MNTENKATEPDKPVKSSLLRNWLSLGGLIISTGSIFAFLLLFALDAMNPSSNPYVGVLAYLVAPTFLILGVSLVIGGALYQRWRYKRFKPTTARSLISIDLSKPQERRNLLILITVSTTFLLLTAIGSYQTYHFTESVTFCGQACHTPMKPQFVTYQHSPHARVSCSECHIGRGATWYVKSKISGLYQVYATYADEFPRPITTPISNLRPAQQTCEQCHWPQKFVGNLDRTYTHYLADETNTEYTVRMLLKVGGGDPTQGPVSGIHWHMSVANKVEYMATDPAHQVIPWVRMTDPQGVVTEYTTPDFDGEVRSDLVRTMDCMDCHNRPSHVFKTPNEAVDLALSLGRLDSSIPYLKRDAVALLTQPYSTEEAALQGIATGLHEKHANLPNLKSTIAEVQRLYSENFFPEMGADWRAYPDNIGHKDWLGCFRCHDGEHKSKNGLAVIKSDNCSQCHTILAQGNKDTLAQLNLQEPEFAHPEEGWQGFLCNDCHTGSND